VDGYRAGRVASAVGHFPGTGAASQDPEDGIASVGLSIEELAARDLRPFAAVTRRAPVFVVTSAVYAAYDGVTPAVHLPEVVTSLLRRRLGFGGVVMTDNLTATTAVTGTEIGQAAVDAIRAGVDVLQIPGGLREQEAAYRAVLAAVRRGEISRGRLRGSVRRIAALRARYAVDAGP
jgi:beta-N-acetylhexosaminidase